MERRSFCKLIAAAAAANAVPSFGQTEQASLPELPDGFNRLTRSYADFCALPPEKRVFYRGSGNRIVETRLDEATWKPSLWNYNPTPYRSAGPAPARLAAGDGLWTA